MKGTGQSSHDLLDDDAARAIARLLSTVSEMHADGKRADEIMPVINWADAVVTGEGIDGVFRSVDEIMPLTRDVIASMGHDVGFYLETPFWRRAIWRHAWSE